MASETSNRVLDLLGVELPIIQAPMANFTTPKMVIEASNAGGLGSLPSAVYSEGQLREGAGHRAGRHDGCRSTSTSSPTRRPAEDPARQAAWRARLEPLLCRGRARSGHAPLPAGGRAPFDDAFCKCGRGLPPRRWSASISACPRPTCWSGSNVREPRWRSSATTVAEALLAGGARRRRGHRHGLRGRRSSRQFPDLTT